jgi:hypothetical protein
MSASFLPRWLLSIRLRDATIHVPASAEVLCKSRFADCESLASMTFDVDSKLQRIDECVCQGSGLTVVHVTRSFEMHSKFCFSGCASPTSMTFEPHAEMISVSQFAGARPPSWAMTDAE